MGSLDGWERSKTSRVRAASVGSYQPCKYVVRYFDS